MPVQAWTVDRVPDMRRLVAIGVHGIMTDRPDLLARVLGR
jgi:glycerophosphoryl diester phosphodiesterase